MLKIGEKITIRYSKQLADRNLNALINKSGIVTRVLQSNGKVFGCYADVKVMRKVRNYYIPEKSIEGPEEVNTARVLSLLKVTVL